jgi:hypothetical protein
MADRQRGEDIAKELIPLLHDAGWARDDILLGLEYTQAYFRRAHRENEDEMDFSLDTDEDLGYN